MSVSPDPTMVEQAIAWHLRLKDADGDVWVEFSKWLETNPANNDVYEAIADGDARMSSALEAATFPPVDDHLQKSAAKEAAVADVDGDDRQLVGGTWRWGAIAASVAVAGLVAVQMLPDRKALYSVETSAGEIRKISLVDGSEILLNGNTRIVLDRNDTRMARMARGEARFAIKHDETDPFTVVAGAQRLVDIGTVFNVVRTDRQLRVGVADGAVRFEGITRSVELRAGDSLSADSRGVLKISRSRVASIGSWADGVLVYDQAPLEEVAGDLSRSIGISLDLPNDLRSKNFSGVIQTDGGKDAVRSRLEELIGRKISIDGSRWSVEVR